MMIFCSPLRTNFGWCLLILIVDVVNAEYLFTTTSLEVLNKIDDDVIFSLDKLVDLYERSLQSLKIKAKQFRWESKEIHDASHFSLNPIDGFRLIRRLKHDWDEIEDIFAKTSEGMNNVVKSLRTFFKFPTTEDISSAAETILKLQEVYNLESSSFADGVLNKFRYNTSLSAHDCFLIGKKAFDKSQFNNSASWMSEAHKKLVLEEMEVHVRKKLLINIYEFWANSSYMFGELKDAMKYNNEVLNIDPSNEKAISNQKFYLSATMNPNITVVPQVNHYNGPYLHERNMYELLCRNGTLLQPKEKSKLKCRYVNNNIPFLRLARLKVEELLVDPPIILFRDVISEDETMILSNIASKYLQPATVFAENGTHFLSDERITETTWLSRKIHEVAERIFKRVEDMTALSTSTSEDLQYASYGIGGFYVPHFDSLQNNDGKQKVVQIFGDLGDRLATLIFYLNNVQQGGLTVFPMLNVTVTPEKGTAVLWFNLDSKGEADKRLFHGGCPVLAGSKLITTMWLHEAGQEFRRPCPLLLK